MRKVLDQATAFSTMILAGFSRGGADAAGKGGENKDSNGFHRNPMNPPALAFCKVSLPLCTPTDQAEDSMWYFQRYVENFPFSLVKWFLFRSSCTSRAGVGAGVMGILPRKEQWNSFYGNSCSLEFERMLGRFRHRSSQLLVLC